MNQLMINSYWEQGYLLFGRGVAVSSAIASLPILAVLLLLGVFRRAAWIAGTVGLIVALLVAVTCYRMPPALAISAALYGAAFGLFPISWIVLWALVLFRVTTETGQFDLIRGSIGRLAKDAPLQALLIAFAFGAFIEGAAGFGTPVAIAAAMLTGLGFSPFRASAICLLANTAPVAFGSIGIPVITLAGTTGLPLGELSAWVGRICTPIALIIPAYLIFAVGGMVALRSVWLPALAAGGVFSLVQLVVSNTLGPQLTDILASLAAMAALFLLCRIGACRTMSAANENRFRGAEISAPPTPAHVSTEHSVLRAWMPYGLLVFFVLLWGVKPIQLAFSSVNLSFPWPMLHDRVIRTDQRDTAALPRSFFVQLAGGLRHLLHDGGDLFGTLPASECKTVSGNFAPRSAPDRYSHCDRGLRTGDGVFDELFGSYGDPGSRVRGEWRVLPILQCDAGLARRLPHRF
jgi:L-lactate permease